MEDPKQEVQTPQAESSEPKAYVMKCEMKLADPYDGLTLEELEKAFDLAGARLTHACSQKLHWESEAHTRGQEFNRVTVAYKKRKHGFTEEQIEDNPSTVWAYAK